MKDNSSHRPRVLVLTSTFPRWKNDSEPAFVLELNRRLNAAFDVCILAPRSPGSKDKETMAGLQVIRFAYFIRRWENLATHSGGILNRLRSNPFNYLLVPFFLLGQLRALISLLRAESFDLIHAHWLIPQGVIASLGLILSRRRIPLICTSHGGDLYALSGFVFQFLKRWTINKSRALTVVSQAMRQNFIACGVDHEKVSVISMGVDLKNLFVPGIEAGRSNDEILFVGRLVEVKGVDVLLKAMSKVLQKRPDIHLTIAGDGPLERRLKELAESLGIVDRIDFFGMVPQASLPNLYRRAALSVFPFVKTRSGVQEGFGLVVLEAMGCKCPVIAGDLPAIHDSIVHEKSGLLVDPGNAEALAGTVLRALHDKDLCLRMAERARKYATEHYDWEIITEKYKDVYIMVLKHDVASS